MTHQDKIRNRLRELRESGNRLRVGNEYSQQLNEQHAHDCQGWLAAVQNLLHLFFWQYSAPI